jgi:hypothetical protein
MKKELSIKLENEIQKCLAEFKDRDISDVQKSRNFYISIGLQRAKTLVELHNFEENGFNDVRNA